MKTVAFLLFLTALSACARVVTTSTNSNPPPTPKVSPSQVVSDFLEALKRRDFGTTYDYVSAGYAANLDKENYKTNMNQALQKFGWNLLNYQILGVQILGDQAVVVAEQEIQVKTLGSNKETQKKINVQYGLSVIDKKWKIFGSSCISNCLSREDFTGQGLNQ
ncbi:MAG TPA: hypothetical protein VH878_03700 [Thermodesulfobacteriota bacterium]